jgi:hypothetical protein
MVDGTEINVSGSTVKLGEGPIVLSLFGKKGGTTFLGGMTVAGAKDLIDSLTRAVQKVEDHEKAHKPASLARSSG